MVADKSDRRDIKRVQRKNGTAQITVGRWIPETWEVVEVREGAPATRNVVTLQFVRIK